MVNMNEKKENLDRHLQVIVTSLLLLLALIVHCDHLMMMMVVVLMMMMMVVVVLMMVMIVVVVLTKVMMMAVVMMMVMMVVVLLMMVMMVVMMMMTTSASPAILHLTHFHSCHLESSECYIPGCSTRKAWHAVRLFEEKNKLALVKYFLLGRPPAPLIQSSESSTLENGRPLFVHRFIISCKIIKQSIFKTSRSFFLYFHHVVSGSHFVVRCYFQDLNFLIVDQLTTRPSADLVNI